MARFIQKFTRETKGAAAIEYAIIVAMIALVIISALTQIGQQLQVLFTTIADTLMAAKKY